MTKLTRFLFAAAIISVAAVVAGTHPQWSRATGLAILVLLLSALVGAGILAMSSRTAERRSARKNLSPSLATLSSAAILAVYAAGYHRTSVAAGGFSEVSGRGRGPAAVASATVILPSSQPQGEVPAQVSQPSAQATRPAGSSQLKNRPAKSADAAGSKASDRASASAPSSAPIEYAPSATAAPQAAAAPSLPPPDAPAPQIAAATDPGVVPNVVAASPASPSKPRYEDGTYYGWGTSRHGDIQASVSIQDGRIASVAITQCLTRYSCSWIARLPNQVVQRQSPEVDYVSGASQSTDAFYGAVVSALSQAHL
jgi:uncharacterized protein with FMN-binding domain